MQNEKREYNEKKRVLFFGLPWTFTSYRIGGELLTVKKGLLKTIEDDCYMYKVQDVKMTTTLLERLFGLSTVICYTGDTTDPQISLTHIKNAKEIKGFILEASEEARRRRRTTNTLDIGASEGDGY